MGSQRVGQDWVTFAFISYWVLPLTFSLIASSGKVSCHVCGLCEWAWRKSNLLRPADCHMSEFGRRSSPNWALKWLQLSSTLTMACAWPQARFTHLCHSKIPDPLWLWGNVCYFKLLNLGLICSAKIANKEFALWQYKTNIYLPQPFRQWCS